MNILVFFAIIACLAIAFVLFRGLLNMARGGSPNRSQVLMRWRVILQGLAIVIVLIIIYVQPYG